MCPRDDGTFQPEAMCGRSRSISRFVAKRCTDNGLHVCESWDFEFLEGIWSRWKTIYFQRFGIVV